MSGRKKCQKGFRSLVTCLFCGKVLSNNSYLEPHIASHTGERPHNCDYCDATFSTLSSKRTHANNFHLGIKYKCKKCKKVFTCSPNYYKHTKNCGVVSSNKVFKPKLVVRKGRNVSKNGNAVVRRKIRPVRKASLIDRLPKVEVQAKQTGIGRAIDKQLKNSEVTHEKGAYSKNVTSHPLSEKSPYEQLSIDLNHLNDFNKRMQILLEQKRQLSRKWDPSFFLHLNRYNAEDSCFSSSFPSTSIITSTSEPMVIEATEANNKQPRLTKTAVINERENKWSEDGRRFGNEASRTKGVKSKVLVKSVTQKLAGRSRTPHKCLQCGNTFNSKINLKRHEKYHDGYKPFKCQFCHHTFHEKHNAARHIATQHQYPENSNTAINRTSVRCGFCGKRFSGGISQLHSHITAAHNDLLLVDSPVVVTEVEAKD